MGWLGLLSALFLVLPASAQAESRILFLLDASGSMEDENRFVRAKSTILNGLDSLENRNGQAGLIVFGGGDCRSIEFKVKPGPGSIEAIRKYLNQFKPEGATPIAGALKMAKEYLEAHPEPKPRLVILTDGRDNCGDDEEPLIHDLKASGMVKHLEYHWLAPPQDWPSGEGPIVHPRSVLRDLYFEPRPHQNLPAAAPANVPAVTSLPPAEPSLAPEAPAARPSAAPSAPPAPQPRPEPSPPQELELELQPLL